MKLRSNNLIRIQLFVLCIFSVSSYQDLECPDKCQPCLRDAVVCNKSGRTTLPESISSTVERLTITNQRFSQTTLSADNFTQFAPPHISLKQFSLRHCNIEIIEAKTFSALTKLESMDLSNNDNLKIESDAFSGLKLRYLQMDNLKLKLGPHVFRGLVVTSLSLKGSSLTSIEYDTLHPLGRTLSKLFLTNNHIKVIDPKLQLVFQNLDALDLTGNPITCNCNMKWLIDFYRENVENPNFNNKRLNPRSNLVPRCKSPIHVANKFLNDVTESELVCDFPNIYELDINLGAPSDARLVCAGKQRAWKGPMQISWFNTATQSGDLGSELYINNVTSRKELLIKYEKSAKQYKCVVNNSMGEASATVNINWPNIPQNYVNSEKSQTTLSNKTGPKSLRDVFFERRYTLLELLAAVTGTVLFTGLLFILIHRFILLKCVLVSHKTQKVSSQQSNLATVSLTTSYDPGVYSNSLTYDVPGIGYGGHNTHMATPHCSSQQFLDFKTQKKIYRKI